MPKLRVAIYTAAIYSRDDFVIIPSSLRGRSSVVERHVANVNVEGSNPFARFVGPTGHPSLLPTPHDITSWPYFLALCRL